MSDMFPPIPIVRDKDDIPWHKAPCPRWLHRCRAQTSAWHLGMYVERCPCGAIRLDKRRFGWMQRNTRRREK